MEEKPPAEPEPHPDGLDPLLSIPDDEPLLLDEDRKHVLEQLATKRWDDLGVLEYEGRLLFPEKIFYRSKEGKFVSDDCLLVIPRGSDLRRARVEAYALAEKSKINPKTDSDLFGDLETMSILWSAIRSPKMPEEGGFPEPLCYDAIELEKKYDRPPLMQVNAKLEHIRRIIDPQVSGLSGPEFAALTATMVARQDLSPLFVCDGATQTVLLLTLAALHQACVKVRSSHGSSEPSTADSSPRTNSSA